MKVRYVYFHDLFGNVKKVVALTAVSDTQWAYAVSRLAYGDKSSKSRGKSIATGRLKSSVMDGENMIPVANIHPKCIMNEEQLKELYASKAKNAEALKMFLDAKPLMRRMSKPFKLLVKDLMNAALFYSTDPNATLPDVLKEAWETYGKRSMEKERAKREQMMARAMMQQRSMGRGPL